MIQKIKDCWDQSIATGNSLPIVLRGAPDDRGILNVGGRIGAGYGPSAVRGLLGEFMLGLDGTLKPGIGNAFIARGGDIGYYPAIEDSHHALRSMVRRDLSAGAVPVVIGGGHDYGYPHVAAASDVFSAENIVLINVDAHLDVRPVSDGVMTSGSPFFMALESGVIHSKNFIEFGIQEHCNDISFNEYLSNKKVRILSLAKTRSGRGVAAHFKKILSNFKNKKIKIVVSFDVDAVRMSQAPGVSAPQTDGFSAREFLEMAEISGSFKNVATIGFFELSPPLDIHQATVRLVATAIHRFATAVGKR